MKTENFRSLWVLGALLLLCLILYSFVYNVPIVEGLANDASLTDHIAKGLKNDLTTLEDSLLIKKYQTNYKNIINDLMKWCDLEILQTITTGKFNIDDGVNTANTELISSLNQYSQFKNTLQGVYDSVLSNVTPAN